MVWNLWPRVGKSGSLSDIASDDGKQAAERVTLRQTSVIYATPAPIAAFAVRKTAPAVVFNLPHLL
ncbi:hypothetical protein [Ectorhizobium quercum]|uniref:hypothetical protein n=1 Tax=Ectorhizobium quercum TaxID=2965071 RepID=UPI0027960079|nr:hypothetical protein [Ectorhizobium quercum]